MPCRVIASFAPCALGGVALSWLWLSGCFVYDSAAPRSRASNERGDPSAPSAPSALIDSGADNVLCRPTTAPDASCSAVCPERCDGKDDDCDGVVDESAACVLAHAQAVCRQGACLIARCDDDHRDCDQRVENGCEVSVDDIEHCGTCSQACTVEHGSARCANGQCEVASCEAGYGDCDGDSTACEVRLDTDEHCGACAARCTRLPYANARCDQGICRIDACDEGHADCDGDPGNGCEQALDTLDHCGACSVRCDKASCRGGVCSALDCREPGRADCDGDEASCEVDTSRDLSHCGSCTRACRFGVEAPHAKLACVDGQCQAICAAGFGDCDAQFHNGCEQALGTTTHCGACGNACRLEHAAASCVDGVCQATACAAGYADCDGDGQSCEQSLTEVAACGACGAPCELPNARARCRAPAAAAASCEIERCADGFQDCDGLAANGCERNVRPLAQGGEGPCYPDASCSLASRGEHHYYFCTTGSTWQQAREACQLQRGGDLAQLADAATRAFLQPRLGARVWIGHNDLAVAGVWVWANTGVPFWQGGVGGRALNNAYASWARGEPNQSGRCGALTMSGDLDDLTCTERQPFVCEVSPDLCPDDPAKSHPGQCGCGVADADADRDGFAECPP